MSFITADFIRQDLNISKTQAYRLMDSGAMPVSKFGRSKRIDMKDYLEYKNQVREAALKVQRAKQYIKGLR